MQVSLHNVPTQQIPFCQTIRIDFVGDINMLIVEHHRNMRGKLRNNIVRVHDSPGHDWELVEEVNKL